MPRTMPERLYYIYIMYLYVFVQVYMLHCDTVSPINLYTVITCRYNVIPYDTTSPFSCFSFGIEFTQSEMLILSHGEPKDARTYLRGSKSKSKKILHVHDQVFQPSRQIDPNKNIQKTQKFHKATVLLGARRGRVAFSKGAQSERRGQSCLVNLAFQRWNGLNMRTF